MIDEVITNKDLCFWYKSQSIERRNPYYKHCVIACSGLNELCPRYLSPNTLEQKMKEHDGNKKEA